MATQSTQDLFLPSLESQSPKPLPYWPISFARLFWEEPGVRGHTWFSRRREDRLHLFAGIIRFLFHVILAPITAILPLLPVVAPFIDLFTPFNVSGLFSKINKSSEVEYNPDHVEIETDITLPDAVLWNAPGARDYLLEEFDPKALIHDDRSDVYEAAGFEPRWMLEVTIRGGRYMSHEQVDWTPARRARGYTALSYPMSAAFTLFQEAGEQTQDKGHGAAQWSLRDRKRISKQFLIQYCSAVSDLQPDREEFVWLDEFCLSANKKLAPDKEQQQNDEAERTEAAGERSEELGRLADIFAGAKTVVVFCDKIDCNHATFECSWGNRLSTLGEILNASETRQMTLKMGLDEHGKMVKKCHVTLAESGHTFRRRMMHEAAIAKKWHLHSILRQSTNSGSDTWQMAIQSLIVEAMGRDRASGYDYHQYLGKGLNGLLPRRAKLHHLKGKDGWADLAWLLELNQGFYNMAALAAVCGLPSRSEESGWIGPPIEPKAGNERLEPLVSAFTVGERDQVGQLMAPPLNVVDAQTIGLHPYVRRDSNALFNNEDTKKARMISMVLLVIFYGVGVVLIITPLLSDSKDPNFPILEFGAVIVYLSSLAFNLFSLVASTRYIERSGWVFLSEKEWTGPERRKGNAAWGKGGDVIQKLRRLDPTLDLIEWGKRQMVPEWEPESEPQGKFMRGCLVDLRTGTVVRTVVSEEPNSMMALAIHGSGITYMLLHRPESPGGVARRVGMASLPPFTLSQTKRIGAIKIGMYKDEEKKEPSTIGETVLGCLSLGMGNSRDDEY